MSPIQVRDDRGVRHIALDRPEKRNAMSLEMVDALIDAFEGDEVRAIVIRGRGGHFCSGGDISDMQKAAASGDVGAAIAKLNRRFGTLLEVVDSAAFPTVAVCEGAVIGGGFGLASVADVTLAGPTARFRLPETQLGITPAQVAPFIVQRVGLPQARRLAVTGATLDAVQAVAIGLAHERVEDVDGALEALIQKMRRCEPGAVRATKALMRQVGERPRSALLDAAAEEFAQFAQSPTAQQGMMAFLSRQDPPWA